MQRTIIKLIPRPPFDLNLTATYRCSYSQEDGVDSYQDGIYTRIMFMDRQILQTRTSSIGPPDNSVLRVEITGDSLSRNTVNAMGESIGRILGINTEVKKFYQVVSEDPQLAPLCQRLYGLHSPRTLSIFEALVTTIVGQQVARAAAQAVRAALVLRYGYPITWNGITYHAFPTPKSLARAGIKGLRNCNLSRRKAEYILEIAQAIEAGVLDLENFGILTPKEFEDQICTLRGVGL
jgi:DNA-3-methyladenine glycosylase II